MAFEIKQGDVVEVLRTLPSNHYSGCLTDPPYGLSSSDKRSPQRKSGIEQNRKGFMGLEWDGNVPSPIVWRELLRTLRPGANLLAFGGPRTHHRLMCAIEDAGFEIRDCLMWLHGQGFPKSFDIGGGIEREIENQQKENGKFVFPPELTEWKRQGTALKPAFEPIVLASKPLDGTFAENALKWGVAGLNIEACRISHNDAIRPFQTPNNILNAGYNRKSNGRDGELSADRRYIDKGATNFAAKTGPRGGDPAGRWPANVLLDEIAAEILDEQTGVLKSGANPTSRNSDKFLNTFGEFEGQRECEPARGADSGGASRFFYCAKASASERDGNIHPTVKPLKLTEYLARLILPPHGDEPRRMMVPFAGSGSEMLGALAAGWDDVLGIEREVPYIVIADRRLHASFPNSIAEAV